MSEAAGRSFGAEAARGVALRGVALRLGDALRRGAGVVREAAQQSELRLPGSRVQVLLFVLGANVTALAP